MAKKKQAGIEVQCVGCKTKKIIPFEEAAKLTNMPPCDKCPMFCVVVSAST